MHLKEGTILKRGDYKIIRFISSGGFGCTYEAVHQVLLKHVAIKEYFPKTFCNREEGFSLITVGTQSQKQTVEKLKEKFIEEACAIAQLSHPNIVKVSDVFEENGTAYYVMDYIEGKSLSKIIEEKGHLTEEEALRYIRQICDALEYVHSQNRLHLDIKPGNIMVDGKGNAILIDFGASKQYNEDSEEITTTLIGKTPGYAPLEQLGKDASRIRPATDIYSLGATLYKCLSGKTPLEANVLADGDELDPLPSNISESTKRAIRSAMEVSSKKRPQTIKDFLAILDHRDSVNPESVGTQQESTNKQSPVKKNPDSKGNTKPSATGTNNTSQSSTKSTLEPEDNEEKQRKAPSQDSSGSSSTSNTKPKGSSGAAISRPPIKVMLIGMVISLIVVFALWLIFGGKKFDSSTTSLSKSPDILSVDSLASAIVTSQLQTQKEGIQYINYSEEGSQFYVIAPAKVKVGEDFSVTYVLASGKGEDFKVADLEGCQKLDGPEISHSGHSTEYALIYKAENVGDFTIPSATIVVDGATLTSVSPRISVLDPSVLVANEEGQNLQEPANLSATTGNTVNNHEWVNLGLPSGTKWATCNIGANSPEDYGNYYSWSETRAKSAYEVSDCETFAKDNQWLVNKGVIGTNGNLTPTYDAASQNWGGSWRMPTKKETDELMTYSTTVWTTLNGVKGRLVKSKRNDNSIFLPAAGYRNGAMLYGAGKEGSYWSSTSDPSDSKVSYGPEFFASFCYCTWQLRFIGRSVRPVTD